MSATDPNNTPDLTAHGGYLDRLVRHLGSRLNTRKHAENFAGNTHTATIKGEGIYGAGKSPADARMRLAENLEREGRLHLFLPNAEVSHGANNQKS
jgi:hypothetical protein